MLLKRNQLQARAGPAQSISDLMDTAWTGVDHAEHEAGSTTHRSAAASSRRDKGKAIDVSQALEPLNQPIKTTGGNPGASSSGPSHETSITSAGRLDASHASHASTSYSRADHSSNGASSSHTQHLTRAFSSLRITLPHGRPDELPTIPLPPSSLD